MSNRRAAKLMSGASLPAMLSLLLHGSAAAGLAFSNGRHSRSASTTEIALVELDVADVPASLSNEPQPQPQPEAPTAAVARTASRHDHPYPVPDSHDARPHDPSEMHAAEPEARVAERVESAPAAVAVMDSPALPTFTIAIGEGGKPMTGAARNAADPLARGGSSVEEAPLPVSTVQIPARLVASAPSIYPSAARADEIEGDVTLEIVLDQRGRVLEAQVVRRAGYGFDEAALAAIRAYRFTPAEHRGRAVRVRMPWTVQFRLR